MSASLIFIVVLAVMSILITAYSLAKTSNKNDIMQVFNIVNNYFKGSAVTSSVTVSAEDEEALNNSA